MDDVTEYTINSYLIYLEIGRSVRKATWLVGHFLNCKKEKDKLKLTTLIIVEKEYLSKLIIEFNRENKELINNLIPKI